MQNIIFPRSLYLSQGGFEDYPKAIWTDVVTWPRWAQVAGFHTLAHGKVSFRWHAAGYTGSTLHQGGDRSQLLSLAAPALKDIFALYTRLGIKPPRWGLLNWFARIFRYGSRPLSKNERTAAFSSLRLVWPHWPIVREAVFWWHAVRPLVRHYRGLKFMALRGLRSRPR